MSAYLTIRTLHVTFALLSAGGFMLRGYWMWRGSGLLQHKLTRVLPHVVDTLLLFSAIVLVLLSGFYPVTTSWINIKLLLLVVYIVLGTIALKRGRTRSIRAFAFLLALVSLAGIFYAALLKP